MSNDDKPTSEVTQAVIEVLRSLGVINENGELPSKTVVKANDKPEPYIAAGIGGGQASYKKEFDSFLSEASKVPLFNVPGSQRPAASRAHYGPIDKEKIRTAAGVTGLGRTNFDFSGTQSDTLMSAFADPFMNSNMSMFNFSLSRTNPYMTNRIYGSGMYGDIPVYFLMMQEQNGGLLYWPVNIREKFSWFRYFARTDPFVGAAIDLHTDLPLSRIAFSPPKLRNDPGGKKAKCCLKKTTQWAHHIRLFERLMEAVYEWHVIGNVYAFCEWNKAKLQWDRITILPPEEVGIVRFPFAEMSVATYRPEPLIRLVMAAETSNGEGVLSPFDKIVYQNLPKDIVESIRKFGAVIMDTDPSTGSFVAHLARKRSPYADMGISSLERVLIPLLQKEHFKYTQLSLCSRLMTPRNKITAPGITPEMTDFLRSEIDLSMENPDYHVVTNFDFTWDVVGAGDRLIQLQPEYERIENEIIAALGITKELITGEASYGGTRITLDILNTRYMLLRDIFQTFVEQQLLLPMAVANDWYEVDPDTQEREYYYPKLTFNRLSIKDNNEAFDALFQLYQKGSIPVKVIYELFNLDANEMNDMLVSDLFTPRDPTFNELTRNIYTSVADKIVEKTDIVKRISKTIGLSSVEDDEVVFTKLDKVGPDLFSAPAEEQSPPGMQVAPDENETELPTTETTTEETPSSTEENETAPEENTTPEEAPPTEETTTEEEVQ